ncbi:tRNA N(3)-methylcytidine methyltransferase METTL6 isoform X2 [Fukomys damarensis]|uniref:tRNA N(3)-methylcytidine methyltransferase METTL6 isoform X2 n=1 Tax=Fukomys damarensis TaxID=885580 RepID=UPI00053FC5CD|nr:tRNA N(3)-methylcytidine methyltransferase METTL6 isoform X2 [Fukomys damarensis]
MASLQRKGLQARILTSEEKEKLKSDQALVSDFKQQKLEQEAQKNWDLFYKRNSINFFKNRHWTTREFEELKSSREFEGQKLTILEAGCGVGNCLFPLLEEDFNIFAYACDFSPRAVEYVKQNPLYDTERCKVFQCDLTKDDLLDNVPQESVDIVMLIFVLSAIHPDKMHLVLQNIYKVLKPGKSVLFRDYGLYDHTMLRFKGSRKLGENFYVRQDGTRSYFFTEEFLAQLFVGTGYEEVISEYVFRETVNKKEDLCVPRVFLQSKFRKPPQDLSPATLHHQVCGISLNTLHRVPTLGSLWLGVRRRREECEQKLGEIRGKSQEKLCFHGYPLFSNPARCKCSHSGTPDLQ